MESESSGSAKQPLNFFRNPAVGIIGSVASIIGLMLAVYFYIASEKTRGLVYFVYPAKAAVVKAELSSRLHIELDGKKVVRDVTAAQIALWNEGGKSIRKENMLSPLVISTGPANPIIEARIQNVTRDVVDLSLTTDEIQNGDLKVNWKILEQNDGAILQLIYFGDFDVPIKATAIVEEQGNVRVLEYEGKIRSATEQYSRRGKIAKPMGYTYLVFSILILSVGVLKFRNRKKTGTSVERILRILYFVVPVVMASMALHMIFWLGEKAGPPFGF